MRRKCSSAHPGPFGWLPKLLVQAARARLGDQLTMPASATSSTSLALWVAIAKTGGTRDRGGTGASTAGMGVGQHDRRTQRTTVGFGLGHVKFMERRWAGNHPGGVIREGVASSARAGVDRRFRHAPQQHRPGAPSRGELDQALDNFEQALLIHRVVGNAG
jgi:hypothetical protein